MCAPNFFSRATTSDWSAPDGLPRIVVTDLASGEAHEIAFDEEAYDLSLLPGYEFDTATLRFVYSSMTTPNRTFDYDMAQSGTDPAEDPGGAERARAR